MLVVADDPVSDIDDNVSDFDAILPYVSMCFRENHHLLNIMLTITYSIIELLYLIYKQKNGTNFSYVCTLVDHKQNNS